MERNKRRGVNWISITMGIVVAILGIMVVRFSNLSDIFSNISLILVALLSLVLILNGVITKKS